MVLPNKRKMKKQKQSNAFKYSCKRVSKICESYRMYLKCDNPHQTAMIVCECFLFSYIVIFA